MKIFIATDHAGIKIKPQVINLLVDLGYKDVIDLGPKDNSR